jgi:hypothetical protein
MTSSPGRISTRCVPGQSCREQLTGNNLHMLPLSLFQDLVIERHALDNISSASNQARLVLPASRMKRALQATCTPTLSRFNILPHRAMFLSTLTHLRLDRLRLVSVPLPILRDTPMVTHVYLQHNQLASMAFLAALPQLNFCSLRSNMITKVGLPSASRTGL